MQIPNELLTALHSQLTKERTNHVWYAACAAALDVLNLPGMASFMQKQAGEELAHAQKIVAYLSDRSMPSEFRALPEVNVSPMDDPQGLFSKSWDLEKINTGSLLELYALACKSDPQTAIFLHWFLTEQIEEEKLFEEVFIRFMRTDCNRLENMDKVLAQMAGG